MARRVALAAAVILAAVALGGCAGSAEEVRSAQEMCRQIETALALSPA